jgi:two-component system chemotaxis sensor kinase CheA
MAISGSELDEFLGQFQALAVERLKKISSYVVSLEESPRDTGDLIELARELHTLKGEARLLELGPIARVAHRMEDVLAVVKQRSNDAGPETWDLVLKGADLCLGLVRSAPELHGAEREVVAFEESVERLKRSLPAESSSPSDPGSLRGEEPGDGPLQRSAIPTAPESVASPVTSVPVLAEDSSQPVAVLHAPDSQDPTQGARLDSFQSDPAALSDSARADIADGYEIVRVLVRDVERILGIESPLRTTGELLERELRELNGHAELTPGLRMAVRRCLEQVSTLLDHAHELDDELRALRMAPLSHLTGEVRRMVRDTARKEHKLAHVEVSGSDVSLDRKVLAALREALTHLATNAVVHGIESPRARTQAGKPEEGRITLEAVQRGGRALVTFSDDGGGINDVALKEAALQNGVITQKEADAYSIEETLRLIFMPGVSTSTQIGEVAGRGVGLDVVLRCIEEVRGTIEAETFPGHGTVFRIDVPVSVATAHLTVLRAGKMVFALPSWSVLSIETVTADLEWMHKDRVAIPLLKLPLAEQGIITEPTIDGRAPAVVLKSPRGIVGIIVDQVLGGADSAIVGAPPRLIQEHELLSAVADIGAGELVPVLDPALLTDVAIRKTVRTMDLPPPARRILVADDSPVTLAVLIEILEGLGYETQGVRDGLEALAEIRRRPPDLLLTDIEMPRLNGFELLAKLRAETATKELPVVVLSSRSSDDDRKKGVELGADAYLIKGDFRQEHLAGLIETLIESGAKSW